MIYRPEAFRSVHKFNPGHRRQELHFINVSEGSQQL